MAAAPRPPRAVASRVLSHSTCSGLQGEGWSGRGTERRHRRSPASRSSSPGAWSWSPHPGAPRWAHGQSLEPPKWDRGGERPRTAARSGSLVTTWVSLNGDGLRSSSRRWKQPSSAAPPRVPCSHLTSCGGPGASLQVSTRKPQHRTSAPLPLLPRSARPPTVGPALAGPAHSTPGPCQQGTLAPSPFGVTVWPGLLALSVSLGCTLSNGSGSPLSRPPVANRSPKVKASGPMGTGFTPATHHHPLSQSLSCLLTGRRGLCSLLVLLPERWDFAEQRLAHTLAINICWAAAVECRGAGGHSAHEQLTKEHRPSRQQAMRDCGLRVVPGEAPGCRIRGRASGLPGLRSSCGHGIWRLPRRQSRGSCAGGCGLGPWREDRESHCATAQVQRPQHFA